MGTLKQIQVGPYTIADNSLWQFDLAGIKWSSGIVDGFYAVVAVPGQLGDFFFIEILDASAQTFRIKHFASNSYLSRFSYWSQFEDLGPFSIYTFRPTFSNDLGTFTLEPDQAGNVWLKEGNGPATPAYVRRMCCLNGTPDTNVIVANFTGSTFSGKGDPLGLVSYDDVLQSETVQLSPSTPNDPNANQNGPLQISLVPYSETVQLPPIEGQVPTMSLNISATIGAFGTRKYVMFDLGQSRVAASSIGALESDSTDVRGYYLERATVSLSPPANFDLISWGPQTTAEGGSVTTSSGINLSTGASLDTGGPSANLGIGVDFGISYTTNLTDFSVEDNSTSAAGISTVYSLSSTIAAATWSVPEGGNVPYSDAHDLVRLDAAGELGGIPLNDLPALAKGNMSLPSAGIFLAPPGFEDVAQFALQIDMHLVKTSRDLAASLRTFTAVIDVSTADRSVKRLVNVSFAPPTSGTS